MNALFSFLTEIKNNLRPAEAEAQPGAARRVLTTSLVGADGGRSIETAVRCCYGERFLAGTVSKRVCLGRAHSGCSRRRITLLVLADSPPLDRQKRDEDEAACEDQGTSD